MIPFPLQEPTQPELRGAYAFCAQKWTREQQAVDELKWVRSHAARKALEQDLAFAEDELARAIDLYFTELRAYLRTTDHQSAA